MLLQRICSDLPVSLFLRSLLPGYWRGLLQCYSYCYVSCRGPGRHEAIGEQLPLTAERINIQIGSSFPGWGINNAVVVIAVAALPARVK